ncbi:MAG: glycerate kinase [Nitrospira sp.]|nr:glycerate kinase [Nitrospira sp.]
MKNDIGKLSVKIFYASLNEVNPYNSVKSYTDTIRSIYQGNAFNRLLVAGLGKAACPMAKALEEQFKDIITAGIVITKHGHCPSQHRPDKIKVFEAGHPVPDEKGLQATEEIVKLVSSADDKTLIVCLISGGGSALLVSPYEGITLLEKQNITEMLLKAGATIDELNAVRKHISKVKGGRLAEIVYPARIISLIISDVIGDRLDVIASGPTSPDTTTYNKALSILEKYGLMEKVPESILSVLHKGANGSIPETPKEGNRIFIKVENLIIGDNKKALIATVEKARELGLDAEIISTEISGEAREVGKWLAKKAIETRNELRMKRNKKVCLISGGETTVTVKGNGKGGRNMELALAFAIEIEGISGVTLLSAGTDGTDGPTDAAGAIVDGNTVSKAKSIGLNPEEYLMNNDSYNFLKKIDDLLITGPTGTNVMDIQIMVIE